MFKFKKGELDALFSDTPPKLEAMSTKELQQHAADIQAILANRQAAKPKFRGIIGQRRDYLNNHKGA